MPEWPNRVQPSAQATGVSAVGQEKTLGGRPDSGAKIKRHLAETKGSLRPSKSSGQLEPGSSQGNGLTNRQSAPDVLYSESLCRRTILQFQVPTAEQFLLLSLPGDELRVIRLGS